jgi:hypothetical protein
MKKILCLNGWGQEPKTLENAFKEVFKDNILTIDYLDTYDVVIGWSYGSQLAIKKIEAGFLRTKLLILIAPIFQIAENDINKIGMPKDMFDGFLANFKENPEAAMQNLVAMSASGDENSNLVFDKLPAITHKFPGGELVLTSVDFFIDWAKFWNFNAISALEKFFV